MDAFHPWTGVDCGDVVALLILSGMDSLGTVAAVRVCSYDLVSQRKLMLHVIKHLMEL